MGWWTPDFGFDPLRKLFAAKLESGGHQVVAASPSSGVNSLTGEGLEQVLTGANVVIDVTTP